MRTPSIGHHVQSALSLIVLVGGLSVSACAADPEDETGTTLGPSVPGGFQGPDAGTAGTPGLGGSVGGGSVGGATVGGATVGGGSIGAGTVGGATVGAGTTGSTTTLMVDGGVGTTPAGDGGTQGQGDASTPVATGSKPPCLKKPSQVVALGDSYVSLPVVMTPKIEALAVAGGALMSGQHYRDYSAPGTTLGSPESPGSIPPQWDQARRADGDIKVVIMDGGGNDIIANPISIFSGCLDPGARQNATCSGIIDGCMNMVRKMAADMKAAGVHDVIYFLYPHVPIGGDDILDYSVEEAAKMTAELQTDTFRIHLIDTRAIFEGHTEEWNLDGIHANETGAQEIAKLIWQKMKSECIAQPASSGCCAP